MSGARHACGAPGHTGHPTTGAARRRPHPPRPAAGTAPTARPGAVGGVHPARPGGVLAPGHGQTAALAPGRMGGSVSTCPGPRHRDAARRAVDHERRGPGGTAGARCARGRGPRHPRAPVRRSRTDRPSAACPPGDAGPCPLTARHRTRPGRGRGARAVTVVPAGAVIRPSAGRGSAPLPPPGPGRRPGSPSGCSRCPPDAGVPRVSGRRRGHRSRMRNAITEATGNTGPTAEGRPRAEGAYGGADPARRPPTVPGPPCDRPAGNRVAVRRCP